ncbi:MAG TPA: CHAD domain-containing protein [Alphaproteobacteria bacterium]|nr:CHAD domain-containing protein [Alphaproteobacteria bacterium]
MTTSKPSSPPNPPPENPGAIQARVVRLREAPPLPLVQRVGPRKAKPARLSRRASAAQALSANLARSADDIAWNGACALAGNDPEAVHQLRIALRRLRAILSLYKKLLAPRERDQLRDLVRAVNAPLGRARDIDVFADEVLGPALSAMPEDRDLAALAAAAEAERAGRREEARDAIRSDRFTRLIGAAELLAAAPPRDGDAAAVLAKPASSFARKTLRRRHKKLCQAGHHLRHMLAAERHQLRIAVKKQRYAAELFAPLFAGSRPGKYAKALSRVQSALGANNDAAVAPAQLECLRPRAEGGAFARGSALVLGFHAGQAEARERRLRLAWKKFKSAKTFWGV